MIHVSCDPCLILECSRNRCESDSRGSECGSSWIRISFALGMSRRIVMKQVTRGRPFTTTLSVLPSSTNYPESYCRSLRICRLKGPGASATTGVLAKDRAAANRLSEQHAGVGMADLLGLATPL